MLDRLTDLEQRQLVLEHRLKHCPLCGFEIELCPLVAEVRPAAAGAPPTLLRLCELIARWGEPGQLPTRVSDLIDRLLTAAAGVEIRLDEDAAFFRVRGASHD